MEVKSKRPYSVAKEESESGNVTVTIITVYGDFELTFNQDECTYLITKEPSGKSVFADIRKVCNPDYEKCKYMLGNPDTDKTYKIFIINIK